MINNDRIKTDIQWELISLFIYLQNVRNLRNKNHDIKPKTFDTLYDMIALTETFFDNGNLNEEYFCDKFSVFRCDRSLANSVKSSGGGTLLAIKKNDNYSIEKINLDEYCDIEIVGAKLVLSNGKCIFVFCVYIPPSRSNNRLAYDRVVMAVKTSGITDNDILIILGDFNLPNIKYSQSNDNKLIPHNFKPSFTADFFCDLNAIGLKQLNNVKNHSRNILDLIFVNDELDYDLQECTNPLVKIDKPHPPIEFHIHNVIPRRKILKCNDRVKEIFDFKRTDFAALNNYFRDIDLNAILENMEVNRSFECFYDTMACAFDQFVPKLKIRKEIQDHGTILN